MKQVPQSSSRIRRAILGACHIGVAIALLPTTMFFGFFSELLALPVIWLGILGVWLCRPTKMLRGSLRLTHWFMIPIELLLTAYGLFALDAAHRSAAAGGGLLGPFGLIPLGIGLVAGCLTIVTLWTSRSRVIEPPTP